MDRPNLKATFARPQKLAEMTKISKLMMTELFFLFFILISDLWLPIQMDVADKIRTTPWSITMQTYTNMGSTRHWTRVRGHTHLENDWGFARIEKMKTKRSMVYLPGDWSTVIKEANLRKPFEVRSLWWMPFC